MAGGLFMAAGAVSTFSGSGVGAAFIALGAVFLALGFSSKK